MQHKQDASTSLSLIQHSHAMQTSLQIKAPVKGLRRFQNMSHDVKIQIPPRDRRFSGESQGDIQLLVAKLRLLRFLKVK